MTLKKQFKHEDHLADLEFLNVCQNAQPKDHVISKTIPPDSVGINGEIRIYEPSANKFELIIKVRNKWWRVDITKLVNFIDDIDTNGNADHDKLYNIRYRTDTGGTGTDKHISKTDGDNWEFHRTTLGNPHATQNYQTFSIGSTASRPVSPQPFQFYGNTDTESLEMWNGTDWVLVA